jgi:hypothetical protein
MGIWAPNQISITTPRYPLFLHLLKPYIQFLDCNSQLAFVTTQSNIHHMWLWQNNLLDHLRTFEKWNHPLLLVQSPSKIIDFSTKEMTYPNLQSALVYKILYFLDLV